MAAVAAVALVAVPFGVAPDVALAAPTPAPLMTGFIPLAADATMGTFQNVNGTAGGTLVFTTGVASTSAGAVLYYDHWEDGYSPDLTDLAAGTTTQVWGDNDVSNGNAATFCTVCTGDVLPTGAVFVLTNNIPIPRVPVLGEANGNYYFDGRDRVSSTRGLSITAGGYSSNLNSVLAASASAYDTSKWGTDFWIPIGQNTTIPAGTTDPFSTTSLQVMASEPNTVVTVDRTGDGIVDNTYTLGAGEVAFVDDNVVWGSRVQSTKPVQVHLAGGKRNSTYELRWFSLLPTPLLAADYLNPVGSIDANQATITYLFNPTNAPIDITATCTGCVGSPVSVPADGLATYASPSGQAVRFANASTVPFVAVGGYGTQSATGSASYDWGFGLVPTNLLTTEVRLGWAPGNSSIPPDIAAADYGPVWISPLASTTVYVDYNRVPSTATSTACGYPYDTAVAIVANASTRISDSVDGSMTGAKVFTCDGTKFAGAWGQDSSRSTTGAPGFDAGYALVPTTTLIVNKSAALGIDTTGDGLIGPGDTVEYTVSIANVGTNPFSNVVINDPLPANTTYVANSTTLTVDGGAPSNVADDVTPGAATAYPFDESGLTLPTVAVGTLADLRFRVQIATAVPAGTASIANTVSVNFSDIAGGNTVTTNLKSVDLSLTKTVTQSPVFVGDSVTFRLAVTNNTPATSADGVTVLDALPAGFTYVTSTASVGSYDNSTGIWTVGDVVNGSPATLDVTAVANTTSATNTAQITGADAVDPDSTPANSEPAEDDQASVTVTASPLTDVSLTKTRLSGPDAASHTTFRLTVANAGPSAATGLVVTDYPPAGAVFVSSAPGTSPAVDGTFSADTWTIPSIDAGGQAAIDVVYTTSVAPSNNYAQVTSAAVADVDSTPSATPLTDANPPVEDDEAVTGIPAIADLDLSNVVTVAPTYVGDTATFTVTVNNDGPTNATGVMATDLLPAGLQFISATPSAGAYNPTTGVWTIGDMADATSVTLILQVRVNAPGTLTTDAQITASTAADPDSTPNNNDPDEDDQASNTVTTTGSTIGDRVWLDSNADGVQDADEPGLEGVTVDVISAGPNDTFGDGDDVEYTAATNAAGNWSLTDLPGGRYSASVDAATLPNGIVAPTFDQDGTVTPGATTFILAGGAIRSDVDFGYRGTAVTGDTVFVDTDGNSAPGPGEGLDGVDIVVTWLGFDAVPSSDDISYATTTDSGGTYTVANLPSGNFIVAIDTTDLPSGLRNSVDPDGGQNSTAAFDLAPGEVDDTNDFGYVGTNSIGDTVFVDLDENGFHDPGEPGLGNVSLVLTLDADANGSYETTVATTSTTGIGTYLFNALPAGAYKVTIETQPGYELTTPESVTAILTDGQAVTTADFGLAPPLAPAGGTIGNLVWDDTNSNGVLDASETGAAGVVVTLRADLDGDGSLDVVATQTTDPAGAYSFANLPVNTYQVSVSTPAGSAATTPTSFVVELGAGQTFDTADFGLSDTPAPSGTIGDLVWDDANADGHLDVGESGIGGVTVTLLADTNHDGVFSDVVTTATTDSAGNYTLTAAPGQYRVTIVVPAGSTASTPPSIPVTVFSATTVDTADFGLTTGLVAGATIGDRVWFDLDNDGVQDAGEPGVNDVDVVLYVDSNGDGTFDDEVAIATTANDGGYLFTGLPAGSYQVRVVNPTGLRPTVPNPIVQLDAGETVTTADIGLATAGTVPFDVAVTQNFTGTATVGDTLTWDLTITNTSITSTPGPITLVDDLPSGVQFVSATGSGWSCTVAGQRLTCVSADPYGPGQTGTLQIIASVIAAGPLTNTVTVSANGLEITNANNSASGTIIATAAPIRTTTTTPNPVVVAPTRQATTTTTPSIPTTLIASTGFDALQSLVAALLLTATGGAITSIARRRHRTVAP